MNCRAYDESDSIYRRCPSAYSVSNASDDFPLPETPVNTISAFRGSVSETDCRLCTRAFLMSIDFGSIRSLNLIACRPGPLSILLEIRQPHPIALQQFHRKFLRDPFHCPPRIKTNMRG